MKYKIKIVETLEKTVEVEAENELDATAIVEEKYSNCEIVLSADNFTGYEIYNVTPKVKEAEEDITLDELQALLDNRSEINEDEMSVEM